MINKTKLITSSALGAALSLAVLGMANAGPASAPKFEAEKCFGVAKAGQNDCATNTSSCAGTSKKDAQSDAWVYVPKGLCGKLAGGSLESK